MKHDLKAINAAIRLGDCPVIPGGVEIGFMGVRGRIVGYQPWNDIYDIAWLDTLPRHMWPDDVVSIDWLDYQTSRIFRRLLVSVRGGRILEIIGDTNAEFIHDDPGATILDVPEETPPFEQWRRFYA